MTNMISLSFTQYHNIEITEAIAVKLRRLCIEFEIKKQHPSALNTNTLGLFPMYFIDEDYNALFKAVDIPKEEFIKTINKIPSSIVDRKRKVTSDPYNLLILWLAHKTILSKQLKDHIKQVTLEALFKLLLYKFFTSLVRHNFPYRPDEATMLATIYSLSNKFDIVTYGTWQKDLTARANDIFDTKSIHYNTIIKFNDDGAILYILSDTQTRLRNKLKTIISQFYLMKGTGDKAKSYNLVGEVEGEKIIKHMSNSFTSVIENTMVQVMSTAAFIDQRRIKAISELFKVNVKEDQMKRLLMMFSETASVQAKENELEKTTIDKKTGQICFRGITLLTRELLQKTYRYALLNKIPIQQQFTFLMRMKEIYSSSRLNDPDILNVKYSVQQFVTDTKLSVRESTISSLSIGLILYILIKSFDFVNK